MAEAQKVMGENWDTLIILDACRYDYFKKVHKEFLKGELKKVESNASRTIDWLHQNFADVYFEDVVYISGNPFVNSKGIKIDSEFDASNLFFKVIDAWDLGWNEELQTTPPSKVAKLTREARAKYPEKRLISHFMQPHHPFIPIGPVANFSDPIRQAKGGERNGLIIWFRGIFRKLSELILGKKRIIELGGKMGIEEPGPVKSLAKKKGNEFLRKAYKKNLEIVLKEVSKLIERLPGKIVITSDHGEFLGEEGLYSHNDWSNDPILREVPWFEVRKK